jgi:hypothetical protein
VSSVAQDLFSPIHLRAIQQHAELRLLHLWTHTHRCTEKGLSWSVSPNLICTSLASGQSDLGFFATGAAVAQEQSVPVSFLVPLQTLCANENQRVPIHTDAYQIVSAIAVVVAPDTEDGACAL